MYARILVPLDGSKLAEQVLPYVRTIGQGLQARIELLRIFEPVPEELADSAHGVYPHRIAAAIGDGARDYLENVAVPLRHDGLSVSTSVHEGYPASSIVKASEGPDTLIAMSTHGRSGIARWALGSVTDKVIHTSTSPLLIIRSQEQEKASRGSASSAEAKLDTLIVPLDGSPLAEQVLPHTVALAKALALRVLLVRVPFVPIAGYLPGYKDLPEIEEAQAKEYLYKVSGNLGQQGLPSVEVRLLHGNAAGAIVDLARETPNSLVTMTTHGRSGVGRWVLGSVTGRVVRHSGVPVLVVH